jgi:hypothetical protein
VPVGFAVTTMVALNGRFDEARPVGFGKDVSDVAHVGGERHGTLRGRSRLGTLHVPGDRLTHHRAQYLFVHRVIHAILNAEC